MSTLPRSLWLSLLLGACALCGCDVISPPPQRACARVAQLCNLGEKQHAECTRQLEGAAEALGKERMDKLLVCVKGAAGCAEAGGCMAGAGVGAMGDQLKSFFSGMGKALQ